MPARPPPPPPHAQSLYTQAIQGGLPEAERLDAIMGMVRPPPRLLPPPTHMQSRLRAAAVMCTCTPQMLQCVHTPMMLLHVHPYCRGCICKCGWGAALAASPGCSRPPPSPRHAPLDQAECLQQWAAGLLEAVGRLPDEQTSWEAEAAARQTAASLYDRAIEAYQQVGRRGGTRAAEGWVPRGN